MSLPKQLSYFQPASFCIQNTSADVCIYGATSGGIIAAIEAVERGLTVALLHPGLYIGGLTTGGLGMTDSGNKLTVSGKALEFYQRVGKHYGDPIEWRFEPKVAKLIYNTWLQEAGVLPHLGQYIKSCETDNRKIQTLTTTSGLTVHAEVFIDASYEGDLMAHAGVQYTVGREGNLTYDETLNGSQIHEGHQFSCMIDPYVIPGDPTSSLLPGIEMEESYEPGIGDSRIQAYNFRMCLTQRDDIRVPFPKPDPYRPELYELLKRYLATGWNEAFEKFDTVRNGKTDTNNHGAVSTDYIGCNHSYPEASYDEREHIFQDHVNYQQGLMWCLTNDPDIPTYIREPMSKWGLCRDEFTTTGGWPHTLYIREARRMISDVIITEHYCLGKKIADDPVALGEYNMDSHNCRRIIVNGELKNEGDVQIRVPKPYGISYRAIVPQKNDCSNLLVPFCLSASHIAFGSIRMEPVFMALGQASAIAADLAIRNSSSVQKIEYSALRLQMDNANMITELCEPSSLP